MKTPTVRKKANKLLNKAKPAPAKKTKSKRSSPAGSGVIDKVQALLEENGETIHLLLEIAAVTIDKSNMSQKKKKVSRAALALLVEVINAVD